MTPPIRPRRSVLYMPGSNARALEKARELAADALIFDLEDAVAPEAKETARRQVAAALRSGGYGRRELVVRINALTTPWGFDDIAEIVAAGPHTLLIPKVAGRGELLTAGMKLAELRAPASITVWAMVETARAVLRLDEIAAAASEPLTRLDALVLGTNDIARETGMRLTPGRLQLLPALSAAVLAARGHGISVIDGVYNDLRDAGGFARQCAEARDLGFDGKTLIHPGQIAACNSAFSPDEAEIAEARRIVALFELPENRGKGAVALDGRMIERLHSEIARRTLALADAIALRDADG